MVYFPKVFSSPITYNSRAKPAGQPQDGGAVVWHLCLLSWASQSPDIVQGMDYNLSFWALCGVLMELVFCQAKMGKCTQLDWLQFRSGRQGFSFSLEQLYRPPCSLCKLLATQIYQSTLTCYTYDMEAVGHTKQNKFVSIHCTQPCRKAHREHQWSSTMNWLNKNFDPYHQRYFVHLCNIFKCSATKKSSEGKINGVMGDI